MNSPSWKNYRKEIGVSYQKASTSEWKWFVSSIWWSTQGASCFADGPEVCYFAGSYTGLPTLRETWGEAQRAPQLRYASRSIQKTFRQNWSCIDTWFTEARRNAGSSGMRCLYKYGFCGWNIYLDRFPLFYFALWQFSDSNVLVLPHELVQTNHMFLLVCGEFTQDSRTQCPRKSVNHSRKHFL